MNESIKQLKYDYQYGKLENFNFFKENFFNSNIDNPNENTNIINEHIKYIFWNGKIENIKFIVKKLNIFSANQFNNFVKNLEGRDILEYYNIEEIKVFFDLIKIHSVQSFLTISETSLFKQILNTISKLNEDQLLNKNNILKLKELSGFVNNFLTYELSKRWLEAKTLFEKEDLLKKINDIKNTVLEKSDSKINIDFNDNLTLEILSIIYQVDFNHTKKILKNVNQEIERNSFDWNYTKTFLEKKGLNKKKYICLLNSVEKKYKNIYPKTKKVLNILKSGLLDNQWIQLQLNFNLDGYQKIINQIKFPNTNSITQKEALQKYKKLKNILDDTLPIRLVGYILKSIDNRNYLDLVNNTKNITMSDVQKSSELFFDTVNDDNFQKNIKVLFNNNSEQIQNIKKLINLYLKTNNFDVPKHNLNLNILENIEKKEEFLDVVKNQKEILQQINSSNKKNNWKRILSILYLNLAKKDLLSKSRKLNYSKVTKYLIDFNIEYKIKSIFNKQNHSSNFISIENKDFKQQELTFVLRKEKFDILAWKTTDLCISENTDDFIEKRYLPIIIFNQESVVGTIIGYLSPNKNLDFNGSDLYFDGFNPARNFLGNVDTSKMAKTMIEVVKQVGRDFGVKNIYIPDSIDDITNRGSSFANKILSNVNESRKGNGLTSFTEASQKINHTYAIKF